MQGLTSKFCSISAVQFREEKTTLKIAPVETRYLLQGSFILIRFHTKKVLSGMKPFAQLWKQSIHLATIQVSICHDQCLHKIFCCHRIRLHMKTPWNWMKLQKNEWHTCFLDFTHQNRLTQFSIAGLHSNPAYRCTSTTYLTTDHNVSYRIEQMQPDLSTVFYASEAVNY